MQQGQCNNDSQVNVQEWILPKLSDEVECIVHDLQAEQEQGTQAQGWVARTEGICASFGKRSKTEEEDREARK